MTSGLVQILLVFFTLFFLLCHELLAATTQPAPSIRLIAHRGASMEAPENTLAALRLGWQETDCVEIDVYLSKDGHVVVYHDGDTKRLAGVDKRVEDQTLAELKALDVGKWKGPQWAGQRIPTLDEVLAAMPKNKQILIEIKSGVKILPEFKRVIEKANKSPDQIILQSFSFEVCVDAKRLFPKYEVMFLCGFEKNKTTGTWSPTGRELADRIKQANLNGAALGFCEAINSQMVQHLKQAHLKVFVWTVDDPTVAKQAVKLGVDAIITNCPAHLLKSLK